MAGSRCNESADHLAGEQGKRSYLRVAIGVR